MMYMYFRDLCMTGLFDQEFKDFLCVVYLDSIMLILQIGT